MRGFLRLFLMSLSMLVGTVVIGHIPLAFNLSERRIRNLSDFGTGLLIGAALSIVLPEGVEAVYSSQQGTGADHDEQTRGIALALLLGFVIMFLIDSFSEAHINLPNPAHLRPTATPRNSTQSLLPERPPPRDSAEDSDDEGSSYGGSRDSSSGIKESGADAAPARSSNRAHVSSTSLGLICHSLADGISLGASAAASAGSFGTTGYQSLDLIVFFAILTHKLPVALGLCAVLLRDGASRSHVRRALVIFAAAAPLGALGTYALIGMLGSRLEGGGADSRALQWWTGELLCVSGGTFLFVATHAMKAAEGDHEGSKRVRWSRVVVMLLGMLTPIASQSLFPHSHAH